MHPTDLLLSMNSFRNPSPVGSSLPSSPAGCSGPQQTLASLLSAKHTGTVGPGSARPLLQPDLAEPPGSPNFCLCSKSVLLTSTYCGKSLSCSLLFFLMMLHVSLMTLQGTRKLHFSFKITTLSARGGDQKAKKKLSPPAAGLWASGGCLHLQTTLANEAGGRRRGAHTHTHVCKTYNEIGQCGIYAFKPNLQFNYNSLWMQS